ncbi:hypothetical protein QJS10_CPB14g00592 [Acorus calamus]|uniref:Uncharacterized protein n=1 Tax=Acorus calamus TaxID=4465 RepID=A0AAV9DC87_ACOCL|nr:hypothetical protein QJS10_CPB14g00592 [Acorus calamus]
MDYGRHISTAMENLWIDEVLYLHSLWHQGPRTRNPNNLSPSPSTSFKKIKKKRTIRSNINTTRVESPPHSGDPLAAPWPCPLPPISDHDSAVGWPSAAALPRSRGVAETKTATAAEQASFVAVQSQRAGVKACQEFFMDLDGGENDDDDDDEGDSMDDDDEDVEEKSKRFEFFLGLLEGNPDLKEYYVKNWEKGEFTCLVCGGMKVKLWRRFVTLVALVQHANTIRRTKTKGAHRDFAKAVCQVLEWDIERLPSVASEAEHLSDGGSKNELGEDGDGYGEKKKGDDLQTKETLNSPIE